MNYTYFVDGKRRVSKQRKLNGAMLKAKEPNFDWSYAVYLEQDDDPDLLIRDNANIFFTKTPLRFYTVPPCGGG